MPITPPWVDVDDDADSAVVMGKYACLVSLAILACIGPVMTILSPIIIPWCVIGSYVHLFSCVVRTLRSSGLTGP